MHHERIERAHDAVCRFLFPCHLPSVPLFFYIFQCTHLMMQRELQATVARWHNGRKRSASAINLVSFSCTQHSRRRAEPMTLQIFFFLIPLKLESQQDVNKIFLFWGEVRDIARPVVCLKLTVFLRLFYFNWWKKKKNEGDIFFFAFSYSRENEIKMCWWISDDGEREGSLPSASSFPSLFFVFFLLVVVYTHLCGGGRYSWSSFLHYFVGQTGRYVR